MRHKKFGKKLNRDTKNRSALFKSLIISLIKHEKITTSVSKAKAVRGLIDKLVTLAKNKSYGAFVQLASFLQQREVINKLTKEIAPRFKDKIGGYSRIMRVGKRKGDRSQEVILEWSVKKEVPEVRQKDKKQTTAETKKGTAKKK